MPPAGLQSPASDLVRTNVADRLAHIAATMPGAIAVAGAAKRGYATCTFAELDADATALAQGLVNLGVQPQMRLVLLVPPGVEFVKLVFALLRSGATTVLVDPGMGRKHLVDCLAAAEPDGFIAVPRAQAVRTLLRRRFPAARLNVTVGRRLFWRGPTYSQLLSGVARPRSAAGRGDSSPDHALWKTLGRATPLPQTHAEDPAAIIFTSGSTGPPKGVLYTHRMFDTQAAEIQRAYNIQPGGVDLACFALFGLFNSAWGVTTVFPDMNFSRPASADPHKLLAAAHDWKITQAFASPAVWDKLSRHCERSGDSIPTLRKVFSCGAPVTADVQRRTLNHIAASGAEMHTPYGATEALPISTIESQEVLGETAAATAQGAGICVGRKFDSIDWRVIRITDEPIAHINDAEELPSGEIGELIVRGSQVSKSYLPVPSPRWGGLGRGEAGGTRAAPSEASPPSPALPTRGRGPEESGDSNALAKIPDSDSPWHRLGDVGYLDPGGRFWYCGRKAHRVETRDGTLFTECVEAVFNQHPDVRRCALVGVPCSDAQLPVVVVELDGLQRHRSDWSTTVIELYKLAAPHRHASGIVCVLNYGRPLPVDVRHNAKINREAVAVWARQQLADQDLRHITPGWESYPPDR